MYQNINKELAKIFKNMSHIYEFLDDKFRALAYVKAAQIIEDLPDDIRNYVATGKINDTRGIGSHTVDKILEHIKTGKIQKFEELKKLIPEDFFRPYGSARLWTKNFKKNLPKKMEELQS